MKTLQPFVDLGWHLVPMNGVIVRLETGKKLLPPDLFPDHWKDIYVETAYDPKILKTPAALTGAVITGESSGVVSIDCDNQRTLEMFQRLDPGYEFIFMSKGKTEGGGSIMYRLTPQFSEIRKFLLRDVGIELDYQTDEALQFLPTSGNKSKVEWKGHTLKSLPKLKEPSESVILLLRSLYALYTKGSTISGQGVTQGTLDAHYKSLAPFCESFLSSKLFAPDLFRILTPNKGGFKDLDQYKQEGTLHPDSVPDGMGNAYLSSVSGVLACDASIDAALFKQMLIQINSMWSKPLVESKLLTLMNYELSRVEFAYDENWHEKVALILTEYGTIVSVFYDPLKKIYYVLDNKYGMSLFDSVDALPKHLNSIVRGNRRYKTIEMYDYLDQKQTIMDALKPYGNIESDVPDSSLVQYNLYQKPRAYEIILNPSDYDEEFRGKEPSVTIKFFEHLIPDKVTRDYVLRFVLTKLKKQEFSEVILYFLGVMGSGKNLFVTWLDKFTENQASNARNVDYKMVIEVDLENFFSKYNLWIDNALFANLDEYGEKTASAKEDKRVMAGLLSYTGKAEFQLRTMQSDPRPSKHKCTFILTANKNRLALDLQDRRVVLINTPKSLADADFVLNLGGKSKVIDIMYKEQETFAYYWSTNYKELSKDEYRTPQDTEAKQELIMRHLPPSKVIALAIKKHNVVALIQIAEDTGMVDDLLVEGQYGKVSKDLLKDMFLAKTDGSNTNKTMMDNSLRELDLTATRMRFGPNRNDYGYHMRGLQDWAEASKYKGDVEQEINLD